MLLKLDVESFNEFSNGTKKTYWDFNLKFFRLFLCKKCKFLEKYSVLKFEMDEISRLLKAVKAFMLLHKKKLRQLNFKKKQ